MPEEKPTEPISTEQTPKPLDSMIWPFDKKPNIQIDILETLFEGYPEMLEQIRIAAKDQFRDVRHQVLWMINQAISA